MPDVILKLIKKKSATYPILRDNIDGGEVNESGEFIKKESPNGSVKLHWQPLEADQMSALPEGDRTKQAITFWTVDEIDFKDRVVINNYFWTVRTIRPWQYGFSRGLMVRTGRYNNEEGNV